MDQLQPVTSTIHNVQMVPAGSSLSMPASIQPMKPSEQMRLPSPMPHYVGGSQTASAGMDSSALYMMPRTSYTGFQQLGFPNSELRGMGTMFIDTKSQHIQMPVKRKSSMENMPGFGYPLSPRVPMPNKEIGQMEHHPLLNTVAPHKGNTQNYVYSNAGVLAAHQLSAQNKKKIQLQAGPPKSGFQKSSAPRSHPSQGQPSPRVQNDEPVRSKLRESICAALALVIEKGKSSSQGGTSASAGANDIEQNLESSESAEIATNVTPAEFPGDNRMDTNDDYSTQIEDNVKSQPTAVNGNVCGSPRTYESVGQELNVTDFMPDEEEATAGKVSATDDLLQGNGLSWVLDFDAWVAEKEGHDPKRQKVGENGAGGREPKKTNSPQNLAFLIELELFKLFGGVNKKYKEKGRSLLFNLKDRNNPELREKVMSGDISPARLCSMSAEELASKELSEWRIAKAEEFDQMKILPDSDIDIRRLVKKTHKGEFQVEVEEDDVSVEVSVGSSTFPRIQTENKETETKEIGSLSGEKLDGDPKEMVNQKNDPDQNLQCTITIPSNESSDLMQGLIENELKDAAFLPPIVSLDEFMESLHSEPPFENLPPDAGTAASLDNDNSEAPSETKPTKLSPDGRTSATSEAEDNMDKYLKAETDIKPTDNQPEIEISPPVVVSKGEQIWEGSLQLSISSTVAVTGLFKSGEKATTKEWPCTMEIKGRVRLDAFEKFLQDLYKSRSRHIMVIHVLLKEQEGKDTEALSQVVDSYVADDRVGFAEPLRGLEVYLCPHHPKILDRVGKHMTKDQTEALTLSADDKGLIGVIVWRKAHVSPHSSSSHHRHSLKKQEHYAPRKQSRLDRNINVNSSNLTPKYPLVPIVSTRSTLSPPKKAVTQEDDLPPGFAPPATQDDDDLPEFNFSGGLGRSVPTQNRPADQMRQLVQKYGQNAGSGHVVKSWKDDDDIPEWHPQVSLPSVHPQPSTPTQQNYQPLNQPMLQHLINQQLLRAPLQQPQAPLPLQQPLLATHQNGAPSWPQQQQQQTGVWINPQGQFFGTQSRGF